MKLNLSEFTSVINKIQSLVSGDRVIPGVMLDIGEDEIKVCYSDGRKALIESIGVIKEAGELSGKAVLDFTRLVSAVSICQPSGKILVPVIDLVFKEDGKLDIKAEKLLEVVKGEETELRKVSEFSQVLSWNKPEDSRKTALLDREDYGSIFKEDGVDIWDRLVLKDLFDRTTEEKGKQIYVSPRRGIGFVCNTASVSVINMEDEFNNAIILSTVTGKFVADILGKVNSDKIYVHVADEKFCKLYTEDKRMGLSFELVQGNSNHIGTLDRYESKDFTSIQLTFLKDVLQNVMKSAMAVSSSEKVGLRLVELDGSVYLSVAGSNTNASIDNNYTVLANGFNFRGDRKDVIEDFNIPISLKVVNDIIGKCNHEYITFDVCIEENSDVRVLRFGELDAEKSMEIGKKILDESGEEVLSMEQKMGFRNDVLKSKHYTLASASK